MYTRCLIAIPFHPSVAHILYPYHVFHIFSLNSTQCGSDIHTSTQHAFHIPEGYLRSLHAVFQSRGSVPVMSLPVTTVSVSPRAGCVTGPRTVVTERMNLSTSVVRPPRRSNVMNLASTNFHGCQLIFCWEDLVLHVPRYIIIKNICVMLPCISLDLCLLLTKISLLYLSPVSVVN